MPKIISKRGKPEAKEVDIELDLKELDGETITVTVGDATEDGQLVFEYYKEDWIIQSKFVTRIHELGCWALHNVHEQTWKIFYHDVQVALVTSTAVQSDMITVLDYVRDTIEAVDNINRS